MMDFPLNDLLDPQRCHDLLLDLLHPDGLRCPNGHPLDECRVHMRHRAPIREYRCKACGRFFTLFSETVLEGTHYTVVQIVQLLRGIAQGTPTARLAREMGVSRRHLLAWRHKLQALAAKHAANGPLPDRVVEADELYQNAGEKRNPAPRPRRPAATPRQQGQRPRDLGQRSTAHSRCRRP